MCQLNERARPCVRDRVAHYRLLKYETPTFIYQACAANTQIWTKRTTKSERHYGMAMVSSTLQSTDVWCLSVLHVKGRLSYYSIWPQILNLCIPMSKFSENY